MCVCVLLSGGWRCRRAPVQNKVFPFISELFSAELVLLLSQIQALKQLGYLLLTHSDVTLSFFCHWPWRAFFPLVPFEATFCYTVTKKCAGPNLLILAGQ